MQIKPITLKGRYIGNHTYIQTHFKGITYNLAKNLIEEKGLAEYQGVLKEVAMAVNAKPQGYTYREVGSESYRSLPIKMAELQILCLKRVVNIWREL